MAANKFMLVENFTWLLDRLDAFVDPQFSYSSVGMPGLKGGKRRIYRKQQHFKTNYTVTSLGKVTVNFGNVKVECDKFNVNHGSFKDDKLKERYPVPPAITRSQVPEEGVGGSAAPASGAGHVVLVTSRDSMSDQSAQRYYVSCSCMDFDTTFLQKLVDYGYTADPGSIPPASGVKRLDPTICKHIYAVIVDNYQTYIALEKGTAIQAADIMPWQNTPPPGPPPGPPVTTNVKKADYEKMISATLRKLSNASSDSISAYKSPADSAKHYRKYKFMVKWYPKGWAIVFTNPALNPFPQGSQFKEMVPVYARTASGLKPAPYSPIAVYAHFTKDELKALIKANSKEIQPPQVTRLKSILGIKPSTPDSSWLTESLEVEASVMNTLREVL